MLSMANHRKPARPGIVTEPVVFALAAAPAPRRRLAAAWELASANPVLRWRQARRVDVSRLLSGKPHAPVVYFVRVGHRVKIGTSKNLRERLLALYLGPQDVLAVVPGNRHVEAAYHRRFADSNAEAPGRPELFRVGLHLRWFLSRRRLAWSQVMAAPGTGSAVALATGSFAVGVLACVTVMSLYFVQLGWEQR